MNLHLAAAPSTPAARAPEHASKRRAFDANPLLAGLTGPARDALFDAFSAYGTVL